MVQTTVELNGTEHDFDSKKEMLQVVGRAILDDEEHAMTVRQLYYRFVGMDLIDNKESQYQYLCESMKEARLDGVIPWDWIEDRTRGDAAGDTAAVDPEDRLRSNLNWFKQTPERYERPLWEHQPRYVEVWVEKEALASVFERVAKDLGVTSLACRGYPSITTLRDAAERFRGNDGREMHIIYFGDHDPSGRDIERHITETMRSTFGVDVSVSRAALTEAQIREYRLPPQPAKRTDARFEDFVEKHGDAAVELDALPPNELRDLIGDEVLSHYDEEIYEERVAPVEEEHTERLRDMVDDVLDE